MIKKFDWLATPLGTRATRIAEIAPDFAKVKDASDVGPVHLAALAYALGRDIELHLAPSGPLVDTEK